MSVNFNVIMFSYDMRIFNASRTKCAVLKIRVLDENILVI